MILDLRFQILDFLYYPVTLLPCYLYKQRAVVQVLSERVGFEIGEEKVF
jgi:hypothetical protein